MHLGLGNSQKAKRFRKFVTRSSTKFDGTDDFVETGAQPDFIHTGATMSSWVKMGDFSGMQFMGTHNSKRFYYGFNGTNAVMGVQNAHNVDAGADLSSFVAVGQWHHIVMVADNGTATFYLDGVARDTLSYTPNAASNPSDNLYIGARGHGSVGQFMNASIDEFAVFSSALTAREVDALYNNGQPTKIRTNPNLAHWFRMGEGKLDGKRDGDSNLLFDQGPNGGLSSEKVTNGSFSADSDWTKDSSWTIAAGVASDNGTGRMFQSFSHGDKTYKVSFDVTAYTSGTARIQIGQSSNALDATSVGSFSGFITADGANNIYVNNSGLGFVGSIDNLSVKEVQNVGSINGPRIQADGGEELVKANAYASGSWSTANAAEFGSNFAKFTRPSSGGSTNAATSYLGGVNESITSAGLTVGATYKISVDVETDDSDVALRVWTGVEYIIATSGSGTKVLTFNAASATGALLRTTSALDSNKFIKFSNISLKEVTESVPKKTQNLPSAGSAKSMAFDATDEFVDTGFQPDFIHTDATISFWCNMANFSGFQALGCYSSGKQFYVGFNGTAAGFALQATGKSSTDISAHITAGLWHHIALVADGGTATYYVDGVARDTHSYTPAASANPDTNFYIGAIPDGSGGRTYHMEGSVSEVAVWDAALDGDAIKALYNAGEPTPVATKTGAYDIYRDNLKAYYKMGDATNPAADGTSSRVDSHLFDQTNPGLGAELSVADPYTTGRWGGLGTNTPTFVAGESVRIDRPASGGSSAGGYVYLNDNSSGFLTEDLVATKVYKLTLLFETDDSNAYVRVTGGGGHHDSSAGSGVKTFYMFGFNTGGYMTFAGLDNGKFLKVSQLSVKPVNGHTGTISGATIQTEAPKQIYALPPVANTKSIILEGDDEFLQTQVDATLATRYYSFWAKATRTTDNPVFDHGDTTVGSFIFNQSSGKPLLYTSAGNWRYWNDTSAQDDGLWHHWTVYFDSADINNSKLWCDGVEQTVQATSAGTPSAYSTGIRIGRGGSVYFEGSLDEFSIHEELDEEAIRALFNRGRPIDISKSQGAYDLSDKALHYWRMGDATNDGTNDIIFQGLEAEDSELITDGGFDDPSAWNLSTGDPVIEDGVGKFPSTTNSFIIKTGAVPATVATYRLTYDVVTTNGNTLKLAGGSSAFPTQSIPSSLGTQTVFVTSNGTATALQFNNNSSFIGSIDNVSLKQVRGQYIGAELFKADADLYKDATWFSYNANEETFPNGTAARFFRPTSGGSDAGGKTNLCAGTGTHALTTNLETGCVYKLQFDFLTDDSDAFPRYYDGSSYTSLPSGSGTKVFYFVYSGSTNTMLNVNDLSADKFVQFSNLSLTKVGGAAVLTNMDSASDIQTDTPY